MRRALSIVALGALVASGCASSGHVPRPYPGAHDPRQPDTAPVERPSPAPRPALSPAAVAAADLAQSLVGAPYRNGGQDPDGFDCSGFVQYVFTQSGIGMPRSVREQFEVGQNIDPADVRPGDLVFFAIDGHRVSHVGIVVGDDAFVHAPSSRGQVRIDRLSMEYWRTRLAAAKRPT